MSCRPVARWALRALLSVAPVVLGLAVVGCAGPTRWPITATGDDARGAAAGRRAIVYVRDVVVSESLDDGAAPLADPVARASAAQGFVAQLSKRVAGVSFTRSRAHRDELADLSPTTPVAELEVRARADHWRSRTYLFELLYFGALLTPAWGEAEHHLELWLDGVKIVDVAVSVPHGDALGTHVQHDAVSRAYARAWDEALRVAAAALDDALGPYVARARDEDALRRRAREVPRAVATSSVAALPDVDTASITLGGGVDAPEAAPTALRPVVTSSPPPIVPAPATPMRVDLDPLPGLLARPFSRPPDDSLWGRYLSALGGLELATYRGSAEVRAFATPPGGARELVGRGEAEVTGYKLSFSRPPDRTGWFFPPLLGAFWEDIVLSGFRDGGPILDPARGDIAARTSDPATGQSLDLQQPLAYALGFRSFFAGQAVGLDIVAGSREVQFFSSIRGGATLLEARVTTARIGERDYTGFTVVPLGGLTAWGQLGLSFPEAHFALRFAFDYTYLRDFAYPEPVELLAARRDDPTGTGVRARTLVEGGDVSKLNLSFGVGFVY